MSEVGKADPLQSLVAVLCTDCTLRCAYCYQRPGGSLVMPWPALRASLDLLLASPSRPLTLEFSGGEPLLALRSIRRAVGYLSRSDAARQVNYLITTNGTLLDADALTFLDRHRFDIRLSFHTHPRAPDREGRETFGRLDRLLDLVMIRYPRLWRERFHVVVTIGVEDVPLLADTIEYLVGKGVRDIAMSAACGQDGWAREGVASIERQLARITEVARRRWESTGMVPIALFRKEGVDEDSPAAGDFRCRGALGSSIAVDATGQAYGCVMMAGVRATATARTAEDPARTLGAPAAPAGPLVLEPDSPLWAFHLGDLRDPGFPRRLARYPSLIQRARVFPRRLAMRSSDARCGTCRYVRQCTLCPVECAFGPGAAEGRVSDFVCAFTRVSMAHRERFPAQPTRAERMSGRAPVPRLVQELHEHAARLARNQLNGTLAHGGGSGTGYGDQKER